MRFTFNKQERLKSKKLIEQLFDKGNSLKEFPLRVVYLKAEHPGELPVQASFSVSKRKFKRAVDRNKLKRLMREAYRKNKHLLYENIENKHILMFTYIDEKGHNYVDIEEKMILLLRKFIQKVKTE